MNIIFGLMDQCDTKIDLKVYAGQLFILHGPVILPYILTVNCNLL